MSLLFRGKPRAISYCKPQYVNTAEITQPNLALTPSDIARMSRQGIAVSTPNAESFIYESSSGWTVEPVYSRYYDRNTAWETSNVSKRNIAHAQKVDKERYR